MLSILGPRFSESPRERLVQRLSTALKNGQPLPREKAQVLQLLNDVGADMNLLSFFKRCVHDIPAGKVFCATHDMPPDGTPALGYEREDVVAMFERELETDPRVLVIKRRRGLGSTYSVAWCLVRAIERVAKSSEPPPNPAFSMASVFADA